MKQKLFILFFALVASTSLLFAQSGTCGADGDNLTWTFSNGILTIYGTGKMASYNNAPWYNYQSSITTVIINSGVTSIGNYAFYECRSLTSVTIPNSVTSIGQYTFYNCTSLTSVTIPNSVTSIGGHAFYGCNSLTSPTYNAHVFAYLPRSYSGAYTIPDGIESIAPDAFYNCTSLTSVTIPSSATSIEYDAFAGCGKLNAVHISDIAAWCAITFGSAESNPLYYAHNLYINGNLVADLTIPNSLTSIGTYAFYYCTGLTSITIPSNMKRIGNNAFYDVPNIVYSGTATGAPWGARCLNGYVEGNLVYRDATKTELLACSSVATGEITIPNSVMSIGEKAFSGCTGLTSITIPNSVTSIGGSAFSRCTGLTSITIPNNVTSIGDWAFYGCNSLTSITIPGSVTHIGDAVFAGCSSLTSITIPNNVTSIVRSAFLGCKSLPVIDNIRYADTYLVEVVDNTLNSYKIKEGIRFIGTAAFSGCSSLTSITIPNSVTSIGKYAFMDCSSLTSVTCYAMNPPGLEDAPFYMISQDAILYVPADAISAYEANEEWKSSFADVRPIGASGTETDQVKVEPAETTATVAWPTISGAGSYELVIRDKDGNALCTLVFNAQGQLTSIDFAAAAAPARDRSNVAAMAQGAGFAFTVTGLESGTTYSYTLKTKNASGAVIDTKTGAFTTQSPTALEDIMDDASSSSVRKVLQNGQLYILRDGKAYTATGAEVK